MRLPNPICWLLTAWYSIQCGTLLRFGALVLGCDFRDTEEHTNATVTISRCARCGKYSFGWWPNDQPPMVIGKVEKGR